MRATPEYGQVVLYDPIIDLMVSVVLARRCSWSWTRSCPCEASGTVSHRLRGVSREKLRTSYRFKNKFRTRID